jgi:cysteine desulfurase family protein (TIGR01976 family)
MAVLDVEAVRRRFPALARTQRGRPVAYLDGPGGSQVPEVVIDAIGAHLVRGTANDGGVFATARETSEVVARARAAAADLTGSAPDEIAFGANMTTLNFLLAHAVVRTLRRGDEIVVTQLDHDANVAPWVRVAEDHGLVVREAPVRHDGTLEPADVEALLGERTRVVAFTLASNALGTVPAARRIAAAARSVGALAWADGVHYAAHRRPDRAALGVDVLLCSPYKIFGPHLGIAAIRRDLAATLPADRVRPALEDPPGHRFETGTQSFEALAGFAAAADYLRGLGDGDLDVAYAAIREHEEALARHALARLEELDHVTVHGLADPARVAERTPTFCLSVARLDARETAQRLARRGLFCWHGDFYAPAPLRTLGVTGGAVRAGLLHYSTREEVDRLIEALGELGSA